MLVILVITNDDVDQVAAVKVAGVRNEKCGQILNIF